LHATTEPEQGLTDKNNGTVFWPLLHATTEPEQSLTDKNNGTVLWPLLHATTEPQQGLTEAFYIKDSGDFNKIK